MNIDEVQIQFNPSAQIALQIILAYVMFGIAIDTPMQDFRALLSRPRAVFVGATAQLLLFPAFTFLFVVCMRLLGIEVAASVLLGMYLLAACPGGNISNFLTHLAGGNTALSVLLSAISTLAAVVMTPFNFGFYAALTPECAPLLTSVELSFWELAQSVGVLLVIPMLVGVAVQQFLPNFTQKITRLVRLSSMGLFIALVLLAFIANWKNFVSYIHFVALIVIIQNGCGLLLGYYWAKIWGLKEREQRTIAIEVGIQNSGLALVLGLNFFPTLGGLTLIAAWWSVWHAVSGLTLARYWSKRQAQA